MPKSILLLKNKTTPIDPYHDNIVERGFESHFVPLLLHEQLDKNDIISFLKSDLFLSSQAFIITSQRAVECLNSCMNLMEECPEKQRIYALPAFTVGPATSEILQNAGFEDIRGGSDAGNGSILSDIILKDELFQKSRKIVFFTGEIRKDIIPKKLLAANFDLYEKILYRTIPMDDIIDRFNLSYTLMKEELGGPHWIVFFSPQGTEDIVEFLVSNIKLLNKGIRLASIGPTTEAYLVEKGLKPHVVAKKPQASSLLESIQNYEEI